MSNIGLLIGSVKAKMAIFRDIFQKLSKHFRF